MEQPELVISYRDIENKLYTSRSKVIQEERADGLYNISFEPSKKDAVSHEEILKLSPEYYGIGVNLKALWHKIQSWWV